MIDEASPSMDFEEIFGHCAVITSSIELNGVVKATLSAVTELLECDQVAITLVTDGSMKVLAADPPMSSPLGDDTVALALVTDALAQRSPIYSPDAGHGSDRPGGNDDSDGATRSLVAVPFVIGEQAIGSVHASAHRADAFSERHRARLIALAPSIAVAMQRALTFERERESWEHRRELDRRKSDFLQLAAKRLDGPLEEVAALVDELTNEPSARAGAIAAELLDSTQRLADLIEEVLDASLKEQGRSWSRGGESK